MKGELKEFFERYNIDYIIPVPLHIKRESERGYNQAGYIAKEVAKEFNKEYYPNILRRVKNTKAQSGLARGDRQSNIKDAFKVEWKECIEGKNILIVDDVITTGGTVRECSKVLKENGAKKVFVLALATGKKV